MKLYLIKITLLFLVVFFKTSHANNFSVEYNVSTSGIKIGKFNWLLEIRGNKYKSKVNLKNSGFFSPIYSFMGEYSSDGIIENNTFKSQKYTQYWKTKKKIKIVEMSFDNYLINLVQKPTEKEESRINLFKLNQYFDPITSFINILDGSVEAKTIDGRRVYIMERVDIGDSKNINITIKDYKNIWADHKRNDLKKIEFNLEEGSFFPKTINIYFKKRVFKLKKN